MNKATKLLATLLLFAPVVGGLYHMAANPPESCAIACNPHIRNMKLVQMSR